MHGTECGKRNKVFSAGANLKERADMSKEEAASFVTSLRNCLNELESLPMPLIASVEVCFMFFTYFYLLYWIGSSQISP